MPCIFREILLEGFVYFVTAFIMLPYPKFTPPENQVDKARAAASTINPGDPLVKIVLFIPVALCCSCSKVLAVNTVALSSEEMMAIMLLKLRLLDRHFGLFITLNH